MKENFFQGFGRTSKEAGLAIGLGTVAWIAFFGYTNPALVTHLLSGASALIGGGYVLEKSGQKA